MYKKGKIKKNIVILGMILYETKSFYRDCIKFTLVILTQRPWLLRYSSPVVRIHDPFFSSMLYLHNFLRWGVWRGFSKTGMSVLEPPAGTPEEAEELNDESLQTL